MAGRGWDPLTEALKRRLEGDILPTVAAQAKPVARWRRVLWFLELRIKFRGLDVLFAAGALVPFGAGIALLLTTYPWNSRSPDFSELVATAATTTAFGGVLLGLLALPIQSAVQLAAGYTAELLRRPLLWLTGLWLVLLAIGLFVLAAYQPDREAAIASGLLTGSALALVWMAARSVIASSDPREVALRQGKFIRKSMGQSRRYMARMVRNSLPKNLRNDLPGELLVRQQEQQIINGFMRHFRAGIDGAIANRQPAAAIVLWDSALDAFIDYAKESGGQVGDSQGISQTFLQIADEMVLKALSLSLDEMGVHAITTLQRAFRVEIDPEPYRVVRSLALMKLKSWTESGWDDDATSIPAVAVDTIGELLRTSVVMKSPEEAIQGLAALHELTARAVVQKRSHISRRSLSQVVGALRAFLSTQDDRLRSYLLSRWVRDASNLAKIRMLEAGEYFMRSSDVVFPGISLRDKGLQGLLSEIGPYPRTSPELTDPLAKWLDGSLADFGTKKEDEMSYFAAEALSVLYCLVLVHAYAVALEQPARGEAASRLLHVLTGWIARIPDEEFSEVLLHADVAEMVWSVSVGLAYCAQDPGLLTDLAKELLPNLDVDNLEPVTDRVSVDFVTGLMIAAGETEDRVKIVADTLEGDWTSDAFHIEGLGRAPSLNRNRVEVADPRLFDVVNRWLLDAYPRLKGSTP